MYYFELYQIPVSFLPDIASIKKQYFVLSKQYHPDFYSNTSPEKQAEILALSTQVNKAYAVLTDMDKRMRYILMEAGFLQEEEKFILPQDFLMEMMDINEKLMEVQMEGDKDASAAIKNEITQLEESLYQGILPTLQNFDINSLHPDIMLSIKTYYFKRKYLLRLLEQVDGGGEWGDLIKVCRPFSLGSFALIFLSVIDFLVILVNGSRNFDMKV